VQTRNLVLYGVACGVYYLGAPVLYVGLLQATLLNRLGVDKFTANLPSSVYQLALPFPLLVAWAFPQPRLLKRLMYGAYCAIGAAGAGVAAVLVGAPDRATELVVTAVILHAMVIGMANGVANALLWEVLRRGASTSRHGQAFSIAFGVGPLFAVIGSVLAQLALNPGNRLDFTVPGLGWMVPLGRLGVPALDYPWSYAILFLATVPCMAVALATLAAVRLPPPEPDPPREPFVSGVFGGVGDYFRHPLILRCSVAFILVYCGDLIMNNFTLYTQTALGADPQDYVNAQNALRFGLKMAAGFFLGWLLTRTHPKAPLLVTGGLLAAGVVWGMFIQGRPFLATFGLLGAGELMGAYYPNYIMRCSTPAQIRRNMSMTNVITVATAVAPMLYGAVADRVGKATGNPAAGLQASFICALVVILAGLIIVQFTLPARPSPAPLKK
jgi:hypothetical protein